MEQVPYSQERQTGKGDCRPFCADTQIAKCERDQGDMEKKVMIVEFALI